LEPVCRHAVSKWHQNKKQNKKAPLHASECLTFLQDVHRVEGVWRRGPVLRRDTGDHLLVTVKGHVTEELDPSLIRIAYLGVGEAPFVDLDHRLEHIVEALRGSIVGGTHGGTSLVFNEEEWHKLEGVAAVEFPGDDEELHVETGTELVDLGARFRQAYPPRWT